MPNQDGTIAYFSLEIGLEASIPTYSGGLGVLAGDTIRAAADLGLPYAAVTLLYRDGYFRQELDKDGRQHEHPVKWSPEERLEELGPRAYVPVDGRDVQVRAFRHWVVGVTGHRVPVYFLDTDLPTNDEAARNITRALYAGDPDHRIRQETVLAVGGKRMLRALTHDCVCFHMNEGHAFLVPVELLSEHLSRYDKQRLDPDAMAYARSRCVFTTHTPVPAGHDRFGIDRVRAIVGNHPVFSRPDMYGDEAGEGPGGSPLAGEVLNTTRLAMNLSRFSNAVARKHAEVSRKMFPGYRIEPITNGVHAATWTGPAMRRLFDKRIPEWRRYNADLRLALSIPDDEVLSAHAEQKKALVDHVNKSAGTSMKPDVFTIAFARRATAYKRPAMLLSDPARLRKIAEKAGPIQVIYAGKAHPHDGRGKEIIQEIVRNSKELHGAVEVAFVPNYDIELCRLYASGSDLWLNNPEPPLEASGTSGMKAALNGMPSLSTMDGWWLEGCVEGVTGWAIEGEGQGEALFGAHADSLYDKLLHAVLPTYADKAKWASVMKHAIAINGSYFTTERMVREYALHAYFP